MKIADRLILGIALTQIRERMNRKVSMSLRRKQIAARAGVEVGKKMRIKKRMTHLEAKQARMVFSQPIFLTLGVNMKDNPMMGINATLVMVLIVSLDTPWFWMSSYSQQASQRRKPCMYIKNMQKLRQYFVFHWKKYRQYFIIDHRDFLPTCFSASIVYSLQKKCITTVIPTIMLLNTLRNICPVISGDDSPMPYANFSDTPSRKIMLVVMYPQPCMVPCRRAGTAGLRSYLMAAAPTAMSCRDMKKMEMMKSKAIGSWWEGCVRNEATNTVRAAAS